VRTLCLIRETLARHDGLADFAFAMQGLGMGAVSLFGTPEQRAWLARTRAGRGDRGLCADGTGVGVGCGRHRHHRAARAGGLAVGGEKTWISNGGIADVYVVFARTGEAPGARGLSAFLMPADVPGLTVAERLEVIAPHPLAHLRLDGVILPEGALIGGAIRVQGRDVGAGCVPHHRGGGGAGHGAARAGRGAGAGAGAAHPGGGAVGLQMVQGHLADMALKVDAAALLIYRAAWVKDMGAPRVSREAAMAKLYATEAAQEVIDMAVQLHGGDGVRHGSVVESLYREIRALRIYEGAATCSAW
jgi:acyl-CoA dehydrogenase